MSVTGVLVEEDLLFAKQTSSSGHPQVSLLMTRVQVEVQSELGTHNHDISTTASQVLLDHKKDKGKEMAGNEQIQWLTNTTSQKDDKRKQITVASWTLMHKKLIPGIKLLVITN